MNVLFPFKKLSGKSLYAENMDVRSASDTDALMEASRQITLKGMLTTGHTLSGTAIVGDGLYAMSALVDTTASGLVGNNMTIVNSINDVYAFPNTMSLFQPSGA